MSNFSKYEEVKQSAEQYGAILVAVSKTRSHEQIMAMYERGQRDFGENRVQELSEKRKQLPADIRWHQIGHLQRNKLKILLPDVSLIHSVDSPRLLNSLHQYTLDNQQELNILLQLKIAKEDSKYGFSQRELMLTLESGKYRKNDFLKIKGLMGMATFTDDQDQIREEFKKLRAFYESLKGDHFKGEPNFSELSMGMSSDYKIALDEGSTMLRVGSLLFE